MMMIFWALAAAAMAIALWFVIPPLTRDGASREPSRRAINLALHRDKLAELEADRARGTLSDEQFEQARADLERHLLQDLIADEGAPATPARARPRGFTQGLTVALPLSAIAFYVGVQSGGANLPAALNASPPIMKTDGNGAAAAPAQHPQAQAGAANANAKAMSMEEAVVQLSKRLAAKPEDGDGWLLLGNSYRFLGKQKEADDAFEKAAALGKTPPAADATPAASAETSATPTPPSVPALDAKAAAELKARLAKHADDAAG